ncbi:MAG: Mut7-C RNAse domain-containing protein [Halobacteriales archaeon]|nr:Mut7-C RNAse domain-containing protein [Halobacteriales archaeon]
MNRTDDRFVADAMLGKLVTYMRMAGYDVLYAPDEGAVEDDEVARLTDETGRVLVTRDVELAESTGGILVESKQVEEQLRELTDEGLRFELGEPTRCSVCNGTLTKIDAEKSDDVPDDVERAWRCDDCGKVYWKGSHWDDVRETFDSL